MSNLTIWATPGRGTATRRQGGFSELNGWLSDTFAGQAPTGFRPAAEVARDGEDAVIRVELPGLGDLESDVKVEMHDGRLVIHGERRDEQTGENDGRTLREVRYGSFRRTFTLPAHVASDAITAGYDAGMLTVRVVGAYAGTSPKQIPITK